MTTLRSLRLAAVPSVAACLALAAASTASSVTACSSSPSPSGANASAVSTSASGNLTATFAPPAWLAKAQKTGDLASGTQLTLQVHLRMRDEAGARAELQAISDPDSAAYGSFLTTEQFAAKYAPTDDAVALVRAHLEASGLVVTDVPSNNAYLAVSGTAEQVEQAFSTHLALYSVAGESRYAPETTPTLPAAVAAQVTTVIGLSTPQKISPPVHRSPGNAVANAESPLCSTWYGQHVAAADPPYGDYATPFPTNPCSGMRPPQVRHAYGYDPSSSGKAPGAGQTIAIVDGPLSPTIVADAQLYAKNNDPAYPLLDSQISTTVGPGAPGPVDTSWYVEEALDIEAVHAMAPGATIALYTGPTGDQADLLAVLNLIIATNAASIISNSWGTIEPNWVPEISAYEDAAIQAGLKGIGLYFSTGDYGDSSQDNGGAPAALFPATLPEVTAVGATSLALDASGNRLFEVGWEASTASRSDEDGGLGDTWSPASPGQYTAGSGGGTSTIFPQPTYQRGVVPSALATSANGSPSRVIPDVAMMGDAFVQGFRIGFTYGGTYQETYEGGTSLSAPLFAATMALAQASSGRRFGAANALLYKAARYGAFRDIVPGTVKRAIDLGTEDFLTGDLYTLEYVGPGNTLATATGFDNVTGLGIPDGPTFLARLASH